MQELNEAIVQEMKRAGVRERFYPFVASILRCKTNEGKRRDVLLHSIRTHNPHWFQ